jgi:uncharacterized protein (TIGR02594 family)
MNITAFDLAQRFAGTAEVSGTLSNPQVLAMLKLDQKWPEGDDVPWCSAFVNYIAWLLRLPRSKSLAARSWLGIGSSVSIGQARVGFDVVVLKRGSGEQPGPEVLNAVGHVGFFAGYESGPVTFGPRPAGRVLLLAGNQDDAVSVDSFPEANILGVRRLLDE